jgi:hypothetical protein
MTQETRIGMPVQVGVLDWLQRLQQWFKSFRVESNDVGAVSQYGTWDPRREQYRPLKADAAMDMLAMQHGAAWSTKIYSTSI